MATNANIGILVPGAFAGQPPSLDEYSGFFRNVEDLGFHPLWVTDRVFHPINIIDPFMLLTCAATVTSRVRLGTAVYLFVLRNPILAAKTIASLDYLSDGRVTMGISLGGMRPRAVQAFCIPWMPMPIGARSPSIAYPSICACFARSR